MRGKLNGHVFSKNRAGAYMRGKVTPVNPQTVHQSFIRSIFGLISQGWRGLTAIQRANWNGSVSDFAQTDIFGDIKNPSGKALYQKINMNLLVSEQTQVDTVPEQPTTPDYVFLGAEMNTTTPAIDLSILGDTTGAKVIVSATPPMSAGVSFAKNKFRQLKVIDGAASISDDILPAYEERFGALSGDENVQIKVHLVTTGGIATPQTSNKLTFAV